MYVRHTNRHAARKQALKRRVSEYVVLTFTPALFAALIFPGHEAHAQAASQAAAAGGLEEIVVTGSRVIRDGYEAPTPLTVVGVQELQTSGQQNIADYVNTIPAFVGSREPNNTNSSMSGGNSGLNAVNLRSLGLNRTLVLLDGQRSVGVTADGNVDLNLFPQALVQRVDVVTGGASAAYGSDAVAGIANFILDKQFVGLKGEGSGSITTYGDNASWDFSLTGGTPLANGRGHFLFSGQVSHVDGIAINDRPWNLEGWQFMTNPSYGTGAGQSRDIPERILLNHVSVDNGIAGGIITTGPLKGIAFGPGGTPYQFVYGDIVFDPDMSGGQWQSATIRGTRLGNGLTSRQNTQSLFTRASYDVTEDVTAYFQVAWAGNWNHNWCCAREHNANLTIRSDNPFIPATVAARMTALNLSQFTMGSMNADLLTQGATNDRRVQRYVVGVDGKFDAMDNEWSWNAYWQKGIAHSHQQTTGSPSRSRFAKAMDAVRNANGTIVCRVNADAVATNDDPACVPYNLLGIGVNSDAVKQYLYGYIDDKDPPPVNFRTEAFRQDVYAVAFNGEPFSLWAGEVSVAFGVEHRRESIKGINDPDSEITDWFTGNYRVFTANTNVTEGFFETVIPLANDMAFARSLELNAAVRATDYSTSGFVTTWKTGLTWAPVDDVRFRGTVSRDIRAPNMQELFSAGTVGAPGIINPFRANASEIPISQTTGNPALVPETSLYTGVGVVVQPSFVQGFSTSVDYWNLDIDESISSISVQQIIDQCYQGNTAFCNAITFQPDQRIQIIRNQPFNLVKEIARGIDFEVGYQLPMSTFVDAWDGGLSLRFLASRYLKRWTSNGIVAPTDTAGENRASGPPNWRWRGTVAYNTDAFNVSLVARGVSSGVYLNSNIECASGCPVSTAANRTVNTNRIDGAIFWDTSFTYKFTVGEGTNLDAFFNVRNLMNKDPVIAAPGPGGFAYEAAPANPQLYDTLGRIFRAGVRFRM